MVEKVLLPIDDFAPWSRAACRKLTEIESADDAVPVLLYPFDTADTDQLAALADGGTEASPSPESIARSRVTDSGLDAVLAEEGFEFEVVGNGYDDEPATAILETVESQDIDRIYLYSRKRSPVGKATFGSSTQRVLFAARVPVVVVPPTSLETRS